MKDRRDRRVQQGLTDGKNKADVLQTQAQVRSPVRRKRRRITRFQMAVILFVAILVVTGGVAALLVVASRSGTSGSGKHAAFGIKKIEVAGETRYAHDAIINASGLSVGQSILFANKKKAAEKIAAAFPYIETISIRNSSFDTVQISVKEMEAAGAIYADGKWLVVSANGKALEALPVEGDRPPRYLYFKGVTPLATQPGQIVINERNLNILRSLMTAFDKNKTCKVDGEEVEMNGFVEIDLSDTADIRLNWRDEMTVLIGNDNNLSHKVAVAVTAMAKVRKSLGDSAVGQIDVRTYSDTDTENDRAVYTPKELLTTAPPSSGTATGSGTTSTTLA